MALTDNIVGAWCEAAAPTTDESGNGETLTDHGTVGTTTGKVGTAGNFGTGGSTKYLSHVDDAALSTGDIDFTFAAWVNLSATSKAYASIFGKADAGDSAEEYYLIYRSGVSAFEFAVKQAAGMIRATNFGAASTATWYHVVAWHDSVNDLVGISVNAGTPNTASYSGGVTDQTSGFAVGTLGQYVDASSTWDGLINQAAMWKRVLTSGERTSLYNGGAGLAFGSWGGGGISGTFSNQNGPGSITLTGVSETVNVANGRGTVTATGAPGTFNADNGRGKFIVA